MGHWRLALPRAVLVCIGLPSFGWAWEHKAALAAERIEGPTTSVTETHHPLSPAANPHLAPLADALPCERIHAVKLLDDAGEDLLALSFALQPLTKGPGRILGQCLTAVQQAQAVQWVHQALLERGYLTTTVGLGQDPKESGVLEFLIHPGRLGALHSETVSPRGLRLAFPGQSGKLLNLRDIEQGLENLSQVPNRSVSIQIVPGTALGQSDLQVDLSSHAPWQGLLGFEYAQGASLGRFSGQAQVSVGDFLGLNERCEFTAQQSLSGDWSAERTPGPFFQQFQGQCTLPIGYFSLSLSSQRESLVQQRVLPGGVAFRYRTQSTPQSVALAHTLIRTQVRKVILTGRWQLQHRQSWIDDTSLPVQKHNGQAWEGALTVQERVGQAQVESTLTARWHTPRPISSAASAPLLRWEGQLTYPLTLGSQLGAYRIDGQGQMIHTAVLPEDQWMLGSRHSIRGFNEQVLLACDRGYRLRQEWSTSLNAAHVGFIAHDWAKSAPGIPRLRSGCGRRSPDSPSACAVL